MRDAEMRHALNKINEIVVVTIARAELVKGEGKATPDRLRRLTDILLSGYSDIADLIDEEKAP